MIRVKCLWYLTQPFTWKRLLFPIKSSNNQLIYLAVQCLHKVLSKHHHCTCYSPRKKLTDHSHRISPKNELETSDPWFTRTCVTCHRWNFKSRLSSWEEVHAPASCALPFPVLQSLGKWRKLKLRSKIYVLDCTAYRKLLHLHPLSVLTR